MKRLVIMVMALMMSVAFTDMASAQIKTDKTASAKAFENANENSAFNRVGDWFATRGKTASEKKVILADRKAARVAKKAQKRAEKKARKMKGQKKQAGKDMSKAFGKGKKK